MLIHWIPGGPFDSERALAPEVHSNLTKSLGLDQPLSAQLRLYFLNLLDGNLGPSMIFDGVSANQIIRDTWQVTFLLALGTFVFTLFIGVLWGLYSAMYYEKIFDRLSLRFSEIGLSLPYFFLAAILIYIFSFQLQWFPPALLQGPLSYVLPVLTLSLRPLCIVYRLLRETAIESLRSDYIRTALSKGVGPKTILFKHVLKNSVPVLIPSLGRFLFSILSGALVVETAFSIPGLGRQMAASVINRDYTLFLGLVLFSYLIVFCVSTIVEFLQNHLDPRIRL